MTGRPADAADRVPAPVRRVRELAVAIGLVALCFAQSPGLVVADTKLDLVVAPGTFLRRALLAWDPHTGFGQLQNQAYGYLFPMGPSFLLGHLAAVPAWVVQRAWWSVLLVVAFTGMLRLTSALQVGTWSSRMVAAVAFSLSPRILTTLGALSVESWPLALAPWVLLPLVRCRYAGQARRAALTSALLFACVGAVNAVATLTVLLPPALWLATRSAGPARRRLAGWWVAGVALASAWWLLPLLLLGGYAYPFLDYIESARVTTSVTSVLAVLRGASDWVAWSPSLGEPSWPAGWWLATATPAVLATSAVAGLGLLGLSRRELPERRFLLLSLLAGVALMAVGHAGPLAPGVRDLLDGPLAALRNVHKLDLLVRVPLAVGLAHLLAVGPGLVQRTWSRLSARAPARWGVPGSRPVLQAAAVLVGLALLVSVAPAVGGDLAARSPFDRVPPYWRTAAAWLDAHPSGRTLLAPATAFGDYRWGHTGDEPLVALTTTSVALRDAVPLGAPGATRLLDGVVDELAAARPSADLAPALAAAGIGRVLLRGDVDPRAAADPVVAVRTTLARSPGLRLVAAFGPRIPGSGGLVGQLSVAPPDRRTLEVWAVTAGPGGTRATPFAEVRRLGGGPESALGRAGAGVAAAPTVAGDAALPGARLPGLVTDTLRRRELDFGAAPGSSYGPTLRAADPVGPGRAAGDLMPAPADQQTVARYADGAVVTASSSAADPTRPGWRGAGTRPAAALDGDGRTAWVSSDVPGTRWLQVRWVRARRVGPLEVLATQRPGLAVPTAVRVVTDHGSARATRGTDGRLVVTPPPGVTSRVRLVVTGSSRDAPLTVTDVVGMTVRESLVVPRDMPADAATDVWVLRRSPSRAGCLDVGPAWSCSPALARTGEDGPTWRRTLRVERPGPVAVRAVVRPVPGPVLDAALDRALGYRASGSSAAVDHPAARAGAAFDGDPATAWLATAQDATPTLTLTLPAAATLTRLSLRTDAGSRSALSTLVVSAGGEQREVAVRGRQVRSRVAPLTARTFRFTIERAGDTQPQPVRIDLDLPGVLPRPAAPVVSSPCALGPELRVAGQVVRFAVSATPAQLLSGAVLSATPCAPSVRLPAGRPGLVARSSAVLALDQVTLGTVLPPSTGRRVRTVSRSAEHRVVTVAAGPGSLLVLDEGANAGWRATAGGRSLRQVTVDGWRQGWVLPAGGPVTVRLDFAPGRWHRGGLAAGTLALLVLVVLGLAERRRARPPGPPLTAAGGWRWEPVVLAVGLGLVLGGAGGALLVLLAVALHVVRPGLVGTVAALSLVAAGVLAVGSDVLAGGRAAGALALLAVALSALSLGRVPVRGHRPAEAVQQRSLEEGP
jgi:arabinofuranan 3-O-arabinosyltransferase